jgi:hypothetical protein
MNNHKMKSHHSFLQTMRHRGAAGKALIVYLASGSILFAGAAYLLFSGIGC